ncbi:MAG: nuclear transport factor 2 family protein [Actinomycetota bacterium]
MTVSQSDHFALSLLADQYCDGVIRKDVDAWGSTWADDADVPGRTGPQWQMRGDPIVGKDAIVEYWLGAMERFEWVLQVAPFKWFEVAEGADTGVGRVVAQERFMRADQVLGHLHAVYHDEYIRTPGGWRFSSRQLEIRDFG